MRRLKNNEGAKTFFFKKKKLAFSKVVKSDDHNMTYNFMYSHRL